MLRRTTLLFTLAAIATGSSALLPSVAVGTTQRPLPATSFTWSTWDNKLQLGLHGPYRQEGAALFPLRQSRFPGRRSSDITGVDHKVCFAPGQTSLRALAQSVRASPALRAKEGPDDDR